MTEPRDYQYFTVHIEADREHAAAERALLSDYVTDDNAVTATSAQSCILPPHAHK